MPNEPHPHDVAYEAWRADPSKDNLSKVVSSLGQTIDYSLGAANSSSDPLVRGQALIMAGKAVQKFRPDAGSSLPTWVANNLQELNRVRRKYSSPLGVPERAQLDAYKIHRATQELTEKHGREPDILSLSDHLSMPVKRIADVRRATRPVVSEASGMQGEHSRPEYSDEALEYVLPDLEPTDRLILQYKTGYGGSEQLQPSEIAARLKLSPAGLTRRSMRIAARVAEISDMLEKTHSS